MGAPSCPKNAWFDMEELDQSEQQSGGMREDQFVRNEEYSASLRVIMRLFFS